MIVEGDVDIVGDDDHQVMRAVLGEMSLLLDALYSTTCVATIPGRMLPIGRADFQAFLVDYPEIALGLLRVLAVRARGERQDRRPGI